jgi:bacteriocin-like protein
MKQPELDKATQSDKQVQSEPVRLEVDQNGELSEDELENITGGITNIRANASSLGGTTSGSPGQIIARG